VRIFIDAEGNEQREIIRSVLTSCGNIARYVAGGLYIVFHDHVTTAEVEAFVERYEKYEFKQRRLTDRTFPGSGERMFFGIFLFNEELINTDYLMELINEENIVKGSFLPWIPEFH